MMQDGTILTCEHVIAGKAVIEAWDAEHSEWVTCDIVASDSAIDLAIIKPRRALNSDHTLELGELESARLNVGERITLFSASGAGGDAAGELVATPVTVMGNGYARHNMYDPSYIYDTQGRMSCGLRTSIAGEVRRGQSGSVAYLDGKFVGILAYATEGANPVAGLIAAEEVRSFLVGVREGNVVPFARLPFETQDLLDPVIHKHFELPTEMAGALVRRVLDESSGVRVGDIVVKVAGRDVDTNGFIPGRGGLPLPLEDVAALDLRYRSEPIPVEVWRKGETLHFEVSVHQKQGPAIPVTYEPSYFIAGPLSFTGASRYYAGYLSTVNEWRSILLAARSPLIFDLFAEQRDGFQEYVILSTHPFPSQLKNRYPRLRGAAVLTHVNDQAVRSLGHAAELIYGCERPTMCLTFADWDLPLVFLEKSVVMDETEGFMRKQGIPNRCSEDLLPLLEQLLRSAAGPEE